jgi:hypothetical protein
MTAMPPHAGAARRAANTTLTFAVVVTALGFAIAPRQRPASAPPPATALAATPAQTPGAAGPTPVPAPPPPPFPGVKPHWIARYSIDVELDTERHLLKGREVITWRNATPNPTNEIRLHLYWNAWRNTDSTWLRERALAAGLSPRAPLQGGGDGDDNYAALREGDWGSIDLTALRLLGYGAAPPIDLLGTLRYIAPDDGNTKDRTVAAATLPHAVGPNETINVGVEWTSRIPRTFARTGRLGDNYFMAQWFPKMAVLEPSGWVSHQFHAATEFYAEYGTYDVRIDVPSGWVVGATGRARPVEVRGGRATHGYSQEDVHDFAWVTSPRLVERRARFEELGLPPVQMRLLLQPEHVTQAERHFAATRAALRYYGQWYGAYPYGHITIVDPAWQSGSGGMEYPTLFTAGTRWLAPMGVVQPESVTVHEAGHQFWYGLVANNEVDYAWLDEGINTFSTARVLSVAYPQNLYSDRFFGGFIPWVYRDIPLSRETWHNRLAAHRATAESDEPSKPTWRYFPGTASGVTYAKTALWLSTLERLIGWPTLQRILSTFFERWRFRHPKPADFFAVANEVSGQELTWFFDQVHRTSHEFDYGVEKLASEPARTIGYGDGIAAPFRRETAQPPMFVTTVLARRYGEGVFPVDVLVRFEDGSQVRERWDGRDRWRAWRYERAARAREANVDPDHVLLLDIDRTNNGRTLLPQNRAAGTKWALKWLVWLQDRLLTFGFVC